MNCDYRNAGCAATGRQVNGRWVCDNHQGDEPVNPDVERALLRRNRSMLTADEQILKEALLDEVDRHRYRLYAGTVMRFNDKGEATHSNGISEDYANQERLNLVDEVINRIRKAKAPETFVQRVGRYARRDPGAKETVDVPGLGRVTVAVRDDGQVEPIFVERPRGHFLSVEAERELRDNPPPMVIDDVDEFKPGDVFTRNMHLGAARAWEHVADIEQRRVSCLCFNPVQTAQEATGRANEATKSASPNIAAFTATTAALTACALGDASAAAKAHRRAADAYVVRQSDGGRAQLERQMQAYRYRNQLLHIDDVDPDLPLSTIVPLAVAIDRLKDLGLIQEEEV